MNDRPRISFIGGGVMAKAFVESLLAKGIVSEDDVMVSSRSWATLEVMRERHHVHTTLSNREAVQFGDIVLLAVKPQNLERVFADIKGVMRPEQVLLSIVAGVGIDRLSECMGHDRIVRCMPNAAAQIGAGVSVWMASPQVVQEDRTLVRSVLGAVGLEIEVDEERYVDMATAVSGTGPAYVFLFIEAFMDAAVRLGFQRDMALELVLQTMEGSLKLARSSQKHVADLKNSITSPGGTAAEAVYELEKAGFRTALSNAVLAAYQRTLTLKG
ncbi:MAG TPA: pyrroline-5-carboxylate reductase [Candidatus Cryosericum sp.]